MVKDEWHTDVYAINCPINHRIQIGKSSNFLDGHGQMENVRDYCEIFAQHFGILLYNANANVDHTGMDTKNLWSPFILSIPKRFFFSLPLSLSSTLHHRRVLRLRVCVFAFSRRPLRCANFTRKCTIHFG